MNHLDEGTIHAWLDGALDATQSRDIEAHVAECPTCSAAVAEARGLIAGASRILGALDDVPAGVIPREAPAAPPMNAAAALPMNAAAAPPRTAARLKARGQWRVARWASGIAAVLVGAVVLSTVHRADRSMERAQVGAEAGFDSPSAAPAPIADTARVAASVAQPAAPPAGQPAPQQAIPTTSRAPTPGNAASKGAGGAAASRDLATTTTDEVKVERAARERLVTPSFGEVPVARAQRVDSARMVVADLQKTVDTARMRTRDQGALSQVAVTSAPTATAEAEAFVGCYRLEPAEQRGIAGGIAGEAARRARGAVQGGVSPPSRAPSPAAPAARADYSTGRVPPMIRLDTSAAALGLTVVDQTTGSATGWWRVLRDSARVDLGTRGVVMLSVLEKVACPER